MVLFILEQPGLKHKDDESAGAEIVESEKMADGGLASGAKEHADESSDVQLVKEEATDAAEEGFVQDEI